MSIDSNDWKAWSDEMGIEQTEANRGTFLVITPCSTEQVCAVGVTMHDVNQDSTLNQLYNLIECRAVDVFTVDAAGKTFNVWIDDETMLNEVDVMKFNPVASMWRGYPIFGTAVIAASTAGGDTVGLNVADVYRVLSVLSE